MAYYLDINGTSGLGLALDSAITETASGNFRVLIDMQVTGTQAIPLSNGGTAGIVFFTSPTVMEIRRPALSNDSFVIPTPATDRCVFEFIGNSASGTLETYQDGVLIRTTPTAELFNISNLVQSPNGNRSWDLYRLQVFNLSGGLIYDYDPSATGGTGSTLPDVEGGNDGALVNFPTDNSQWVFYDDGGGVTVTADAAFSVSAPSFAGSTSATLPQPTVDIDYSISAPTVSVSASASLPNPSANVSYAVNSPAVSASALSTLPRPTSDITFTVNKPAVSAGSSPTIPNYNASVSFVVNTPVVSAEVGATSPNYSAFVSFTVATPSVATSVSTTLPNPTAAIDYTVNAPSIDVNAAASLPQPLSDIGFTVNTPSVSAMVSATQTRWNIDAGFTVNAPSVSITTSAALPQPDSVVSLTVSPPQVAVVAIVGGIAIIVDDETNINQRVLSTNINAPILSNNING